MEIFMYRGGFVDGYVQKAELVFVFGFSCEGWVWVDGVEVVKDGLYVCLCWVIDQEDVVYVSEVVYDLVLLCYAGEV